jgi:hypothetical protein
LFYYYNLSQTNTNNTNELSIVAQIYSEMMESLVEKMENRYVVGFNGAISIILLTVENLIHKKLETLEGLKENDYDRNIIENDIQEIKKTLQRTLERLG